jgi:hypothetical protein
VIRAGDVTKSWITIDEWLSGPPERIYNMISGDQETARGRSNSMRQMREAFGLPLGNEHIHDWLSYWDSLSQDQRMELRRINLKTADLAAFPSPKEFIS